MTATIVFENLKHKPMRSLLSVLLIGVPVTLILALVGVAHGMLEDSAKRSRGIGADVWFRPANSSLMTLSGAPLPEKLVAFLQAWPHVKYAVGAIQQPIQTGLFATGIDLQQFDKMNGGFTFIEGGPYQRPNDVIVDEYYARQRNVHAGGTITLWNKSWRVAGVFESGKLARVVLPLPVVQDLSSSTGKVGQIYLKLDDPKNTAAVIAALKEKFPDNQIYSMEELLSMYSVNSVAGLKEFIGVIIAIGVIIGFAVVCLSMYMAVLQRTREIGILKSLGASQGFILKIIVAEAVLMGIGGSILGIVFSYGTRWLIGIFVPGYFQMAIAYDWWPIAAGITTVAAALGSLYPGISAARHDPIEALAYE